MANYLVTPNMQLPNPVPGVDPGPDYANNLQSSLSIIDQHNHSAGNGVLINPNGLNINADLPFGSNNATLLRSTRFSVQGAPLSLGTDLGCLYVSGVDLYYNDVNGNQIQITSSGTVNATSSGIVSGTASAAFSGGVLVVKSSSTSAANVLLKSVELTNSGNLTNILTLQAPTLSGSSTQTLPNTPAATSFMQMDTSGNMSASVPVANGIGPANLVALNIASSSNVSPTTSSITPADLTGLVVTITTSGRPIFIGLVSGGSGVGLSSYGSVVVASPSNAGISFVTSGGSTFLGGYALGSSAGFIPCSSVSTVYAGLAAGTYTIQAQGFTTGGALLSISNAKLIAYEL